MAGVAFEFVGRQHDRLTSFRRIKITKPSW
jgi:hypothetical protein